MSCRKAPAWYSKTYGHDPGAWEEAREQCLETLKAWARDGRKDTYTKLVEEIDAIPWPEGAYTHRGSQIGWLLGQVSLGEWLEHRPLLSALVISAAGEEPGYPSYGFFDLARQLGELKSRSREEELLFWGKELDQIAAEWQGKS